MIFFEYGRQNCTNNTPLHLTLSVNFGPNVFKLTISNVINLVYRRYLVSILHFEYSLIEANYSHNVYKSRWQFLLTCTLRSEHFVYLNDSC